MTITPLPTIAIAYTRVSSDKQRREGKSLAEQRLSIEAFAERSHILIEEWFEEAASAYGIRSIARRSVFQAAVEKAEKLKLPIVVASFDRVSRDLKSFIDYVRHRDLVFLSAEEGCFLTPANFEARIARAEAENRRRSQSGKDEYAQRRALGLPPRNPDLDGARQKSADVRGAKAQAKADHLATILRSDPSLADLSLQKLAERLNELGRVDLQGKPWTKTSVHSAMSRLKEQQLVQVEASEQSDEGYEEMIKNPTFGMF